jgi:GMP synthase (glutamine-hydrolysing)
LIAAALDGEIVPGKNKNLPVDISWEKIMLTSAGEKIGLHQFTHENNKVLLWQNDYYEAPQHSTILATGGLYGLQAFSVGQNILGLQFHAEVTEIILKEWLFVLEEDLIAANLSLNTFQKAIAEYMPSMSAAAKAFWLQWFAR